jgi:hypothetical protein
MLALAALALAGCTSSAVRPGPRDRTHTSTVTHTRSPQPPTFRPPRPAFVPPLPPGARPRKAEHDHRCPYIETGLNQDYDYNGGVNLADLEGDRVYRTTVLTEHHPVGCRFYFYAPPYEAIAEIRPFTLASARAARDAMILTARTGHELIPERGFVKGLVGISFRTKFFRQDGGRDWAFVFAKGKRMVIVYTQQDNVSRNALYIARAIAKKF